MFDSYLSEIFPAVNTYYFASPSSSPSIQDKQPLLTIILLKNVNSGDETSLTPLLILISISQMLLRINSYKPCYSHRRI